MFIASPPCIDAAPTEPNLTTSTLRSAGARAIEVGPGYKHLVPPGPGRPEVKRGDERRQLVLRRTLLLRKVVRIENERF